MEYSASDKVSCDLKMKYLIDIRWIGFLISDIHLHSLKEFTKCIQSGNVWLDNRFYHFHYTSDKLTTHPNPFTQQPNWFSFHVTATTLEIISHHDLDVVSLWRIQLHPRTCYFFIYLSVIALLSKTHITLFIQAKPGIVSKTCSAYD